MNRVALLSCIAVLSWACSSTAPPEAASSRAAAQAGGPEGVLLCEYEVDPSQYPPWWLVEADRVYKPGRAGVIREWVFAAYDDNRALRGAMVVLFQSVGDAQAFSHWLDHDYALEGIPFWERPMFRPGRECRVLEVLGREDRPSTELTQASLRMEQLQSSGMTREQLLAWFEVARAESRRRGHTSTMLLHSEERQTATLAYFDAVPMADRHPERSVPVASAPPLVRGSTSDWSGWTAVVWFPFETGDQGRRALWPMPSFGSRNDDGVCVPSRHESTDCKPVPDCGNGVHDPGELVTNCPADVPLP